MKKTLLKILALSFIFSTPLTAAIKDFKTKVHGQKWNASWASDWGYALPEYRVLHFRRSFDLKEKPETFKINVSADQRFILYVNGELVARGPARGDLYNWYYDTIDIVSHLKKGKNVIAALVWHAGRKAPLAQLSNRLAFILDGATTAEEFIATPSNWKMKSSSAYSPISLQWFVGPGDDIDGSKYDWGWTDVDFDDSKWRKASSVGAGFTVDTQYGEISWMLKKREIPQLEEKQVRLKEIRRLSGIENMPNFISGKAPLTIPANSKCKILLDNGVLTNAYPVLKTSKGKGSAVTLKYAEALFDKNGEKANRNEIDGRDFHPTTTIRDTFRPDGGSDREFSPLWIRTYRYVGLDIETKDEPLVIEDLYGFFTGYPFKENGSFASNDKSIEKIWQVGWRTARLCALETYMDCPYYEQLQYVGDTRIQALISLYVSGDDRLMRQAISAFNHSRSYFGITKSRHPSRYEQHIPPFSLYWISMLNDFAMLRDDKAFVEENLDCVRTILSWYEKQIEPNKGVLKARVPFWNFVDWCNSDETTKGDNSTGWHEGVAPEGENDGSAITSLHLALTLKDASNLMRQFGKTSEADEYFTRYQSIIKAVYKTCWNKDRKIFMDFAGAKSSSQHVNIMAILSDALPKSEQPKLMKKILEDKSLTQCTFYYRFYLTEALRKTGMGNLYVSQLKPWYDMIKIGLTTFAENPEPTRSDCHAWSASPNYHLLSLVCGITPDSYGFKRVSISPNLGELSSVNGVVPHPNGDIKVNLKRVDDNGISGNVVLPENLEGDFIWNQKKISLKSGENKIEIK